MSDKMRFEFGDQVGHVDHPEWGSGSVAKVQDTVAGGKPSQKITVRFPNAGIKMIQSISGKLQRVDAEATSLEEPRSAELIEELDRMSQDDLLAPVASRRLQEIMLAIPEPCRDPFRSLSDRIESTLALWRFDEGSGGLNEWAVIQTGLDDPLARFNRHELEEHFKRWSHDREQHLKRLLREAGDTSIDVDALLAKAPSVARRTLQRVHR